MWYMKFWFDWPGTLCNRSTSNFIPKICLQLRFILVMTNRQHCIWYLLSWIKQSFQRDRHMMDKTHRSRRDGSRRGDRDKHHDDGKKSKRDADRQHSKSDRPKSDDRPRRRSKDRDRKDKDRRQSRSVMMRSLGTLINQTTLLIYQ